MSVQAGGLARANRLVAIIDVATRDVKRASSGVTDPRRRTAEAKTATSSSAVSRALFSSLDEGGEVATAAVTSGWRKKGGGWVTNS